MKTTLSGRSPWAGVRTARKAISCQIIREEVPAAVANANIPNMKFSTLEYSGD